MDERQLARQAVETGLWHIKRHLYRLGSSAIRRVLLQFTKWLLSVTAPLWGPILGCLLLGLFAYFAMFMVPKYIASSSIGNCNYDVRTQSRISEETLNQNLGGLLAGYGGEFIRAGEQNGINPAFLAAVAMHETGNGTSQAIKNYNNVGGMLKPGGGFMTFSSISSGINAMARNLKDLYLDEGLYTIGQIQKRYAPVGASNDPKNLNANWIKGVTGYMGQMGIQVNSNSESGGPGNKSNGYVIFSYGKKDVWGIKRDEELFRRYMQIEDNFTSKYQSQEALADQKIEKVSGNSADEQATVNDIWGRWMKESSTEGANIVAAQDQVKPHIPPWSLLGSIDRVTGDPIIHGRHGIEEKEEQSFWSFFSNNKMNGRDPDSKKNFEQIAPNLEWKTFNLYYYHWWEECDEDGSCTSYSEKYEQPIQLLVSANAFDANFSYQWKEKVIERRSKHSYTKIVIPELLDISHQGPYFQKVANLLAGYDLKSNMDLELTLQLASNMDENFAIEGNLFSTLPELNMINETYTGELGPTVVPTSGRLSSPFGMRLHPILNKMRMHTGIDISAPSGVPVKAMQDGMVVFAGNNGGYGKCIIIDHGTHRTLYAHLQKFEVYQRDKVKGGTFIGRVGSTGASTGPHLHFEVLMKTGTGTTPVNPLRYIKISP